MSYLNNINVHCNNYTINKKKFNNVYTPTVPVFGYTSCMMGNFLQLLILSPAVVKVEAPVNEQTVKVQSVDFL